MLSTCNWLYFWECLFWKFKNKSQYSALSKLFKCIFVAARLQMRIIQIWKYICKLDQVVIGRIKVDYVKFPRRYSIHGQLRIQIILQKLPRLGFFIPFVQLQTAVLYTAKQPRYWRKARKPLHGCHCVAIHVQEELLRQGLDANGTCVICPLWKPPSDLQHTENVLDTAASSVPDRSHLERLRLAGDLPGGGPPFCMA